MSVECVCVCDHFVVCESCVTGAVDGLFVFGMVVVGSCWNGCLMKVENDNRKSLHLSD